LDADFVPYVATVVAILLGIVAMGVLIYFISHIANMMRLESVVDFLARSLADTTGTVFPAGLGHAETVWREQPPSIPPLLQEHGAAVEARASGYVRRINEGALMRLATRHDLLVRIEARPGDYVVAGMVLMTVAPAASGRLDAFLLDSLRGVVVS
jgi:uncharacterized membrane protein